MKRRKSLLSLLLALLMVCNLAVPVGAVETSEPILTVTASATEFSVGEGTADVIYTVKLNPNGNRICAFEFELTAPEGVKLTQNPVDEDAGEGANGYWTNDDLLYHKQYNKNGLFTTFAYAPTTGYFGASGGLADRCLTETATIMTIKATVDVSAAKTFTLGVSKFICFGAGSVNFGGAKPVVDAVAVKGATHTCSAETLTPTAEKAATCTTAGNIAYWTCTCGKLYKDANAANEINQTDTVIPATGEHTWKLVVKEVEGATQHTKECTVCGATQEETHEKWEGDVKTDTWQSDETNHWNVYGCGTIMNKTEHQWATPTYTWSEDFQCTAKTVCGTCQKELTETVAGEKTTTPATCETAGQTTYTATFTKAGFETQTKTETIAAKGHAYGDPVWSWDGTTAATATFTCANDTTHVKTETAAVTSAVTKAATCTEMGTTTYTATVTVDGKKYTNEISKQNIDKIAHSLTETPAKDATCTEAGNKAYWTCSNCGTVFASDKTAETTVAAETIAAKGHDFNGNWVSDASGHACKCTRCEATDTVVAHTYSGKPCNEDDYCTVCNYKKNAGEHAWGTAEYTWGADNNSCKATVKCTNCEAVETDAAVVGITTTPATCTVDGKTVYTATFSSALFTTQTKEVPIFATGHKYGEPTWSWSTDNKSAIVTFTCTNEGCTAETTGHAETLKATVTSKVTTKATCTAEGTTTYTAKVTFGGKDYTDTKAVADIAMTAHKLVKTAAKAATCTTAGNNEYWTCSVCKTVFASDKTKETTVADETLAALGHKMTKTEAVTPTCAAEGNNAYYTCGTCKKVFKDEAGTQPTTVAAEKLAKNPTNHVEGRTTSGAVEASCMTAGRNADTYCKSCGALTNPGTIIQPTGEHSYVNGVCTVCGNKQPAEGKTVSTEIKEIIAAVQDAVEEVLDEAIKDKDTSDSTKAMLVKLKTFVSGGSRSKLKAVYSVTMTEGEEALGNGETLDGKQNMTIAISEEAYNELKSGARIVESYLDANGEAQTEEISVTLNRTTEGGYTATFAANRTAVLGLVTQTRSSSGSGSSYTAGKTFTTDLPAGSITGVSVNGKKLDSKYYVISGSDVTLTEAYLATLKAGKYTVRIENATHVSTGTFTVAADGALSSPRTADAGIALYAVMAVSSLMGTAVVSRKRRRV